MERTPTPAIIREITAEDRLAKVLSKPADTVTFKRGFGSSGYKVEVVAFDCPAEHCSFDRMVRRHDVSPEHPDEVRYWCLNPNCAHYAERVVSHACAGSYPSRVVEEPVIYGDE